ncbi:MAG: thioredoxin family protein [Spirochaetes bacterium]|nr:thioredoxin family protein [Spirochaetota bacterium]
MKNLINLMLVVSLFAAVSCSGNDNGNENSAAVNPEGNSMMMSGSGAAKNFFDLKGLSPAVVSYTGESDAQKAAAEGTAVYFFAAVWCPTCKAAYDDIKLNSGKIPSGFTLIFVNYDTQRDLIKKYAVTYQHTFVKIDGKGKALKIWSGSRTVADILREAGA